MADRIRWRECSKKHALSPSEGFVQQGRSLFDARSENAAGGFFQHSHQASLERIDYSIIFWTGRFLIDQESGKNPNAAVFLAKGGEV